MQRFSVLVPGPVVPLWCARVRARLASFWHSRPFALASFRAQQAKSSAMPSEVSNAVPAASNVAGNSATVGTPQASMPGDGNLSAQASKQLRTLKVIWSGLYKSRHSLLTRNPDVMVLLKRAVARARTMQLKHLAANVRNAVQTKFNALISIAQKVLAKLNNLVSTTVAPKASRLLQLTKQRVHKSRKALPSIATAKGTYRQLVKYIRTQLGSVLPPVKGKVNQLLQLAKCTVSKVRDATAKILLSSAKRLSSELPNTPAKANTEVQQIKKQGVQLFKILSSIATNNFHKGKQLVCNKWTQLIAVPNQLSKCTQLKMRLIVKIIKAPTKILRTNPECIFYEHFCTPCQSRNVSQYDGRLSLSINTRICSLFGTKK